MVMNLISVLDKEKAKLPLESTGRDHVLLKSGQI